MKRADKYSFFLLMSLLLLSVPSFAQEQVFKAFVRASNDFEVLNAVMVKDVQSGRTVTTDATGYFEI